MQPPPRCKTDAEAMGLALRATRQTRGTTWPNPTVGCVITAPDGTVLATASTQVGGRPHAETQALAQAGDRANGATAYVTLEPCNHTSANKPVSCTDALIAAGIARVVVATADPDARMGGKSLEKLRAAGIVADVGLREAEAIHTLRGHFTRTRLHRPYITLKLAHSRDGKLGLPDTRTNITSPASWARTYVQRGKVDAVLVGINTVLSDDPQLTDRSDAPTHQPVRVVLDTHARLPLTGKLAQTAHQTPVWLLTNAPAPDHTNMGIRVLPCPLAGNTLDIHAAITALYDAGLGHILVEGGARIAQSLLDAGLVDEVLMIEGAVTIGANGIPCPALPDGAFTLRTTDHIGPDIWRIYDAKTPPKLT